MVTEHGLQRTCERTGLNSKRARRFVEKSLKRGLHADECSGRLKKYLLNKPNQDNTEGVIFNGYCFIVADKEICITMFPLPDRLTQKHFYNGKDKINNPKKYIKYYELSAYQDYDDSNCPEYVM